MSCGKETRWVNPNGGFYKCGELNLEYGTPGHEVLCEFCRGVQFENRRITQAIHSATKYAGTSNYGIDKRQVLRALTEINSSEQRNDRKISSWETSSLDCGSSPIVTKSHIPARLRSQSSDSTPMEDKE